MVWPWPDRLDWIQRPCDLPAYSIGSLYISCMPSRESRNYLHCLVWSRAIIWCVRLVESVLCAYIHGVPIFIWVTYICEELVRKEMGAYIHGVLFSIYGICFLCNF